MVKCVEDLVDNCGFELALTRLQKLLLQRLTQLVIHNNSNEQCLRTHLRILVLERLDHEHVKDLVPEIRLLVLAELLLDSLEDDQAYDNLVLRCFEQAGLLFGDFHDRFDGMAEVGGGVSVDLHEHFDAILLLFETRIASPINQQRPKRPQRLLDSLHRNVSTAHLRTQALIQNLQSLVRDLQQTVLNRNPRNIRAAREQVNCLVIVFRR